MAKGLRLSNMLYWESVKERGLLNGSQSKKVLKLLRICVTCFYQHIRIKPAYEILQVEIVEFVGFADIEEIATISARMTEVFTPNFLLYKKGFFHKNIPLKVLLS